MDDIPRNVWYRFFEKLPGMITWIILLAPIILSFRFPRAVAIFVSIYVVLWFLRSMKQSIFLIYAYRKSKEYERIDWNRKLAERKTSKEILHVVIMPTYKEEKEILESSIEALAEADFPLNRIIFILATEERDSARASANAEYLSKRFAKTFREFHHVMHPSNLPNELPAKGANITYACQKIANHLKHSGMDFRNVIVTTLDADNRPHPKYFSILTYHYLAEPEAHKSSYQPLAYFYNNIWDVPFTNRLVALANTFWFLSESGESANLFTASAYAQSLDALVSMDFWSRHTVVEDLHQFWKSYFHFRGNSKVIPLFIPVYQDALQNRTYFTSLLGQYKQLRRWAYGAAEIPYIVLKMVKLWKALPRFETLARLSHHFYLQILWATAPIIVLLNKFIPEIINPEFGNSLFAYNLGKVLSVVFALMLLGITVSLWISLLSLPRPAGRFGMWRKISSVLQWALLPLVTILYGAIPAIDAQTRLMFGKSISFGVTEKIRKIN